MAKIADGASDLCLGRIDGDGLNDLTCKEEPDFSIERKINWASDGKSILAWGFKTGTTKFGIVEWTTRKPFSTDPADYKPGEFVTDLSKPGEGVLDAAISPDGKRHGDHQPGRQRAPGAAVREARRLPARRTPSRPA